MECKKTFEAHKIRNAAETLQCVLKAASLCFCWVDFFEFSFFLANNSSFCMFLGQGAVSCVKELETIMLMTTVKWL